jgi:hypothetical protein
MINSIEKTQPLLFERNIDRALWQALSKIKDPSRLKFGFQKAE